VNTLRKRNLKGFTLIELLVVIVVIAILAAVVFVALDPVRRFAEARNSRRWNDVNNILTAVHEYIVDNNGALPTGLSTGMAVTQLGTAGSGCDDCGTAAACVDLSTPLARYLASIPEDPSTGSTAETRYSIEVDANNIITISACGAELSEAVSVSR
jgi:prepilin-type N-terminal cleavage/methylation domain-containing protein